MLLMAVMFTSRPVAAVEELSPSFPDIIALPTGFEPEGIVIGRNATIYAGSLADGSIYRADLRTGVGEVFVTGGEGQLSVGLSYDGRSNNLFVAGGLLGNAKVYDADSGELLMSYQLGTPFASFINDVIVTRQAAYFTDSFNPFIYRIPLTANGQLADPSDVEAIELVGDFEFIPGPFVFNANGIEASANGKVLIVVNSTTGTLYKVNPSTGYALAIDLDGAIVTSGDGLVLQGRTLFVVRNSLNQIDVVQMNSRFTSGTVVDSLTSDAFQVPTTADIFGNALYAVNAEFGTPDPATTEYEIVRITR